MQCYRILCKRTQFIYNGGSRIRDARLQQLALYQHLTPIIGGTALPRGLPTEPIVSLGEYHQVSETIDTFVHFFETTVASSANTTKSVLGAAVVLTSYSPTAVREVGIPIIVITFYGPRRAQFVPNARTNRPGAVGCPPETASDSSSDGDCRAHSVFHSDAS